MVQNGRQINPQREALMTAIDYVQPRGGLPGTLRLLAIVAVLMLAGMGVLVVLDVVPLAAMSELSIKVGLLAAIAALSSVIIWVLMRINRR